MIPFNITPSSITVLVKGRNRQLDKSHINFDKVRDALLVYSHDHTKEDTVLATLETLVDIPAFIALITEGRVAINENAVQYDGKPVHGHAAERLLFMLHEGINPRPLMKFLDRLHQNPVVTARDELLHWLEHSHMPLTPEGEFIAYKFVNAAYRDAHSNTIDNSVGAVIPRFDWESVNTNRGQTCAESGYHFCSFDYLGGGWPHVMLIAVAPEDVSSFPYDTEIAKGRCVFYRVIGEVPKDELGARMVEKTPVYGGLHAADPTEFQGRETGYDAADLHEDDEEEVDVESDDEADVRAAAVAKMAAAGPRTKAIDKGERTQSGRKAWKDRLAAIEHNGQPLTPAALKRLVRAHGQREASRLTGIPRSTMQDWLD